ncbi:MULTISPECIES: malate dehydrogenase (quinone) [Corynebacterium]|uniref:Probable malate:quinone oxidoreductase n=1 Tax=Corynebacterium phoceense TaxID=1686286 RepID=A0A540R9Y9_9CORY|nr:MULTISPECIES: malate dehydrogenase (quinone) [Corynebacterium]MBF9010606.1 malate dehydrogenase (quinone) [Corynebacterium phoceense]OFL78708.1 malate:quinone oxidoreductase [Corynebacterium sp. HMSC077B05]OFP21062.1 malate:quinone oxidoreductase [Corynebacterium sp. HMSC065A05]OFP69469.1 malate:quinone oxidoreductase [Corynebacterium sp. HMSC077D10]TQE44559.1 malate dehydrogenase (quinone) [Corynebacterium phoceense]
MSSAKKTAQVTEEVDVALVGGGIMSATLGAMLRELEPSWTQMVFERLDGPALESSSPWNNAGTGHSALCELNYTPEKNGRIDATKAFGVNEKFQVSRQFWAHQLNNGILTDPKAFINQVPHVSFAQGSIQVDYLKRRYELLKDNHMFPGLEFSDDDAVFQEKLPLMSKGRDFNSKKVAISWTDAGTDVNFGALAKQFFTAAKASGTEIRYGSEVIDIKRDGANWKVYAKNVHTGDYSVIRAKFVFVGAGGYALDLLRKAGVKEVAGYAGFPVSGLWLRAKNSELISQHQAKVYGKAAVGAPPMSVPHLDTRVIDGEKGLLFGPYGGWSPKFLKKGSYLDLFKSIRPDNIPSYLGVAAQEFGLTKYLVSEVLKDFEQRVETLKEYVPSADPADWETVIAGQRVQVIKPAAAPRFGSLEFGTTLINNPEGNIAGLLGASPGASIAPAVMVELIERCFGEHMIQWGPKLQEMIPSYGETLAKNVKLYDEMWEYTQKTLKLEQ